MLLLDEPTNHLDVDAKAWLMSFLRSFRGALLVISHDLALLDRAITRVLHLDEGELVEYRGTYSQYLVARKADEERRAKIATRQDQEIRRLRTLADSMRHQTEKRARIAKTLDHRVEKLNDQRIETKKRERTLPREAARIRRRAGRTVLEVADLAKAFGPKVVFEDVTFDVERGERLLVLGPERRGQDHAARARSSASSKPDLGDVRLGHEVSLGYYAQEHEGISAGRSVLEHVREASGRGRPIPARTARHVRPARRARLPGRGHALGRREDQARAGACLSPGTTTCCCSTSPPTTSTRRRALRSVHALRDMEGRDGAREPRHRVRHRARARPRAR